MDSLFETMPNMRVTRAYKRGQKSQAEHGNNATGNGRGKRTRSSATPAPMMQNVQPPMIPSGQSPMMQAAQAPIMHAAPAPPYHTPTTHGHAAAYARTDSNNAQRMLQHQHPQLSAHYQGVLSPPTNHAERHTSRYYTRAQGNERATPYVRPDQNMTQSTSNQRLYPNMVPRTTTTYSVPEQLPQLARDTEQTVAPRYNTRSAVHNLPLATAPTMERYWAANASRASVSAHVDASRASVTAHVDASRIPVSAHLEVSRSSATANLEACRESESAYVDGSMTAHVDASSVPLSVHLETSRSCIRAHLEASRAAVSAHLDAFTTAAAAKKINKSTSPLPSKSVDGEVQTDFNIDDDEVRLIKLIRSKGIPANKINVILEKDDFIVTVVEKSDYRPVANISDEKYDEIVKHSEDFKNKMSIIAKWQQYMFANAMGITQGLPAIEYPWQTPQPRSSSPSSTDSTGRASTPALPACALQQLQDEAPTQLQVRTRRMTREANKEKNNEANNAHSENAAAEKDQGKKKKNASPNIGPTFPIPTIFNHNFNINRFMQHAHHAHQFPMHPFNQGLGPNHLQFLQDLANHAMFDPRFHLPPGMNPYAAMQGWH